MNALTGPLVIHKSLEVRLAETPAEVEAAQALRYRVFYEDMAAVPTPEMEALRRDFDRFDPLCDHLLVLDRDADGGAGPAVVGCYRLLRGAVARANGGFYSAQEYDLTPIATFAEGEVVELGRSCVDPAYRTSGAIQLLWRALAQYLEGHGIELMFGCGSFPGSDPDRLAEALSYLHHRHPAPADLRPRALSEHYVDMARLAPDAFDAKKAAATLPPLIKGYLRLGGFVGDGAVVDHQFNTTDVCIIVKTDQVTEKYRRHFTEPGSSLRT